MYSLTWVRIVTILTIWTQKSIFSVMALIRQHQFIKVIGVTNIALHLANLHTEIFKIVRKKNIKLLHYWSTKWSYIDRVKPFGVFRDTFFTFCYFWRPPLIDLIKSGYIWDTSCYGFSTFLTSESGNMHSRIGSDQKNNWRLFFFIWSVRYLISRHLALIWDKNISLDNNVASKRGITTFFLFIDAQKLYAYVRLVIILIFLVSNYL